MPKIYLYAEILTHIRQLSLHASLQTAKAEGTKVDVSVDKKVITVVHDGETQKLYLPTQISGTAQVIFPTEKNTEISARVQIDDEHEWKCKISNEIEAPWMAADLTEETAIRCRKCHTSILSAQTVHQWKDLPSENWAELMDFWFCHKPREEQAGSSEGAAQAKGFSSTSKLAVTRGIGMTDLTSIVLHDSDCSNLKVNRAQDGSDTTSLQCRQCHSLLGTINLSENLVRLSKSSICMNVSQSSAAVESYPASVFLCAQILSLIETTALKKFVVHSTSTDCESSDAPTKNPPLLVWVFNPDIFYSCSAYDGNALASNVGYHTQVPKNPRNDDTSQIYLSGEEPARGDQDPLHTKGEEQRGMSNETVSYATSPQASPIKNTPESSTSHNPNLDDTSQIYGASPGPQIVSGDIELEVPVSERHSQTSDEGAQPPVEPMFDTETPFISGKTTTNGEHQNPSHPTPVSDQSQNEHINLVHRATKIFYKPLPSGETPAAFLEANSTSHEELNLSNPAEFEDLHATLEKSNSMLPASAKAFQDWKVGLLDRFEKVPSGLGVMQENPLARGLKVKDGRVTRWSLGDGAEGLYA